MTIAFTRLVATTAVNADKTDFIEEPVQVKNLENVRIKQISAGVSHSLIKCTKLVEFLLEQTILSLPINKRELKNILLVSYSL